MELSLGHNVGSNVVEAYARGQLVAKRRFLMEQWGAFLTGTLPDWEFLIDPSLVVVPLRALRRDGARHWVRIFDLSRRELCDREVTIGQITVAGAEIVSGLDPDDLVAPAPSLISRLHAALPSGVWPRRVSITGRCRCRFAVSGHCGLWFRGSRPV